MTNENYYLLFFCYFLNGFLDEIGNISIRLKRAEASNKNESKI